MKIRWALLVLVGTASLVAA
jgi:hypothetical protein